MLEPVEQWTQFFSSQPLPLKKTLWALPIDHQYRGPLLKTFDEGERKKQCQRQFFTDWQRHSKQYFINGHSVYALRAGRPFADIYDLMRFLYQHLLMAVTDLEARARLKVACIKHLHQGGLLNVGGLQLTRAHAQTTSESAPYFAHKVYLYALADGIGIKEVNCLSVLRKKDGSIVDYRAKRPLAFTSVHYAKLSADKTQMVQLLAQRIYPKDEALAALFGATPVSISSKSFEQHALAARRLVLHSTQQLGHWLRAGVEGLESRFLGGEPGVAQLIATEQAALRDFSQLIAAKTSALASEFLPLNVALENKPHSSTLSAMILTLFEQAARLRDSQAKLDNLSRQHATLRRRYQQAVSLLPAIKTQCLIRLARQRKQCLLFLEKISAKIAAIDTSFTQAKQQFTSLPQATKALFVGGLSSLDESLLTRLIDVRSGVLATQKQLLTPKALATEFVTYQAALDAIGLSLTESQGEQKKARAQLSMAGVKKARQAIKTACLHGLITAQQAENQLRLLLLNEQKKRWLDKQSKALLSEVATLTTVDSVKQLTTQRLALGSAVERLAASSATILSALTRVEATRLTAENYQTFEAQVGRWQEQLVAVNSDQLTSTLQTIEQTFERTIKNIKALRPPDLAAWQTSLLEQPLSRDCRVLIDNIASETCNLRMTLSRHQWLGRMAYRERAATYCAKVSGERSLSGKVLALLDDYIQPAGGWFLSLHWGRSAHNIACARQLKQRLLSVQAEPRMVLSLIQSEIYARSLDSRVNHQGSYFRRLIAAQLWLEQGGQASQTQALPFIVCQPA